MVKQKWLVVTEKCEVTVEYSYSALSGKTTLCVDGESFSVKGKPFGIGCERRETVIIGGEQAILDIKKGGKAALICREGEVKELKVES